MSLFSGARGVEVHGGQLIATTAVTNYNRNTYLGGPTGIDILRKASAPEAAYDSSARSYSPRCFPGTREQYIRDIVGRATPSLGDNPLPIYWMKGPAGVGKSAIAQTCAERLREIGALGAAFFFSANGQRKSDTFFPSIAYQLSITYPPYRDLIDRKIRYDNTLVGKAMRFQFRYLIDEPLRELEESGKGINKTVQIFVDGLDECESTDAQCEIIRIVAAAASEGAIPLRWTFFSRPEPHIETMLSKDNVSPFCCKITLPISRNAEGEIELYLRNAFNNILPRNDTSTQALWPSTEEMNVIIGAAGGSFIYATTVIRFVSRPNSLSPQKRLITILDAILARRPHADSSTDAPFAELDAFYLLILRRVPKNVSRSIHLLLALLCQLRFSGAMFAANTLGMSKDEFGQVCQYVSAVVQFVVPGKEHKLVAVAGTSYAHIQADESIWTEILYQFRYQLGGRVSFYHKSFLDFLLDPTRSGDYCVRASEELANRFVKVHLDFDPSFCWRDSELIPAPGPPVPTAGLSYPYTNDLGNLALKVVIYSHIGDEDSCSFPVPQESGRGLGADRDFRKWLYTFTQTATTDEVLSYPLWGCQAQGTFFLGTLIEHIPSKKFPKPTIAEFKSMIKWQEQAGIIQRYHPKIISRIKLLFHSKSREGVKSALYRVGHGVKSIFWYWEIDHELEYYRSFRSIDLAEGERRFREEDFNLWPEYNYDDDDGSF